MKVNFTNINFDNDVQLSKDIEDINVKIKSICNNLPALNIVKDKLNSTIAKTKEFIKNKKKFVVFGTGGSNLGARALINTSIKQSENILFFDNIDPLFFQNQVVALDIETTGFIVISKSGTTPETLSQLGCLINIANEKLQQHFKRATFKDEEALYTSEDIVVPPSSLLEAKDFLIRHKVNIETKMIKNCGHQIPIEASSIALNYIKKNLYI